MESSHNQIVSLYNPACGSGGMLTESREYLLDIGVRSAAIQHILELDLQSQGFIQSLFNLM